MEEMIEKIAANLPDDCVISLHIEEGSAWVELYSTDSGAAILPDAADKTIVEQLNDALCVANGFMEAE